MQSLRFEEKVTLDLQKTKQGRWKREILIAQSFPFILLLSCSFLCVFTVFEGFSALATWTEVSKSQVSLDTFVSSRDITHFFKLLSSGTYFPATPSFRPPHKNEACVENVLYYYQNVL